jgi:3-hydroxybutyryl-CoA dehydrogenase
VSGDAVLGATAVTDVQAGPIVVVGGGTMGAGIALLAALHGRRASIVESDDGAARAARERIARTLDQRVERGRTTADAADAARASIAIGVGHDPDRDAGAPLAIEAVPERLELKHDVLRRAGQALPAATLASNTSSIPIGEIAAGVPHPERVIGLHFFNPPTEMRLVELIVPPTAAAEHVEVAREIAAALGRTAIEAADAPGFVVNRCARPYYLEPLRIVSGEDRDELQAIDAACQAAGFPLGPFALMDLIGVDVGFAVARTMWERGDHEPRWEPRPIQQRLVSAGWLGRKAGRGFYDYDAAPPARPERIADRPAAAERAAGRAREAIDAWLGDGTVSDDLTLARILVQLVNEARFAVAERVATADAIDQGMTLGLRHPVGPSRWAAWIGEERIDAFLDRLAGPTADPVYRRPAAGDERAQPA